MRSFEQKIVLAIACIVAFVAFVAFVAPARADRPKLAISIANGQKTFHIGERIPLKLALTGPNNGKYSIDTASYDRSGRLTIDEFSASPATGWSDPLEQYFFKGDFIGGGLRGSASLSSEPADFFADLNEQIRFDTPGIYSLTATSHRVGKTGNNSFPVEPYLVLQSNRIEIQVIAVTPEWQAEKFRSALEVLAQPLQDHATGPAAEKRDAALADLRFLNSPASIKLLPSYLRDGVSSQDSKLMWTAALGLAGVPAGFRQDALRAMSAQLEDPAFPVGNFFLEIMALLEADPQDGFTEFQQSHNARFDTVWQLALAGLDRKKGSALGFTAATLLGELPDGTNAVAKERVASIVAAEFPMLRLDRQIWELSNDWSELGRHSMVPAFRSLIEDPPKRAADPFNKVADLNTIILKRWFEQDAGGALAELSSLLSSVDPLLDPNQLDLLPGDPQPQFEVAWADDLLYRDDFSGEVLLTSLLVRFGTGQATAQVSEKLEPLIGKWACQPQANALAYLVKFDSDSARALFDRALDSRETGCSQSLFSDVSAHAHGDVLDEAAVVALQSSNTEIVADAAQYLHSFGTEPDKERLLERYRSWNEQWKASPDSVDSSSESGNKNGQLGKSLAEALIASQGWLADQELTSEVLRRCIGKEMCEELRRFADEATAPVLSFSAKGFFTSEILCAGQYCSKSLEMFDAKVAQFPAGSKFIFPQRLSQASDQLELEREALAICAAHGMTVDRVAAPVDILLPLL